MAEQKKVAGEAAIKAVAENVKKIAGQKADKTLATVLNDGLMSQKNVKDIQELYNFLDFAYSDAANAKGSFVKSLNIKKENDGLTLNTEARFIAGSYNVQLQRYVYTYRTLTAKETFITTATSTSVGLMSAADKKSLDDLINVSQDGFIKDCSVNKQREKVDLQFIKAVNNDDSWEENPKSVSIPAATATEAGVMTAADKTKLDSITNNFLYPIYVKAGKSGQIPFSAGELLLLRVWGNLTGIQKTVVLVSAIEPHNVLAIPLTAADYLTFAAITANILTVTNKSDEELSIGYCKLAYTLRTIE